MVSKKEEFRRKALVDEWKKSNDSKDRTKKIVGATKQRFNWIATMLLTVVFFALFEFLIYKIFGDIFQEWVWWFELPATAAEKQNPLLNIFVIVKILFGFAVLVLLPFGGALVLSEKLFIKKQ